MSIDYTYKDIVSIVDTNDYYRWWMQMMIIDDIDDIFDISDIGLLSNSFS